MSKSDLVADLSVDDRTRIARLAGEGLASEVIAARLKLPSRAVVRYLAGQKTRERALEREAELVGAQPVTVIRAAGGVLVAVRYPSVADWRRRSNADRPRVIACTWRDPAPLAPPALVAAWDGARVRAPWRDVVPPPEDGQPFGLGARVELFSGLSSPAAICMEM